MATAINISPRAGAAAGINPVPNEVGDLWSIALIGSLPGNVATSSTWYYRQVSNFSDQDDPAQDLNDAFITGVGAPWELLKILLSNEFQLQCTVVRNLSQDQSFTNTFQVDAGGEGNVVGEIHSTNTVVKLRIQADGQNVKERKVIYLPGFPQSNIVDSKVAQAQLAVADAAINAMYTINGPVGTWSWQYTSDPEANDTPAENAHLSCFIGRLKGRTPSLC